MGGNIKPVRVRRQLSDTWHLALVVRRVISKIAMIKYTDG